MAAMGPAARPTLARMGLTPLRALGLGFLALAYLVAVPLYFAGSNYILSVIINATLLSFISLGVWLTFAIGRIRSMSLLPPVVL